MREYGLAGNMHFRFLHLIKQVLKSTRYTTGGLCSVSAQASGAGSAGSGLEGGSAASHGRRRPPARSLRLGERAIPTQENDRATAREREREGHGRLDRAGASRGWSSMRWLRTRPKPKISGEAAPYS